MSRELGRTRREVDRAWRAGIHEALDRGRPPDRFGRPPAGRVVEHCCDAMAAVRVQAGSAGSDGDLTLDVRILLRWGEFEAGLVPPDDPEGEWVLRLGTRDRGSGESDVLSAALRQAADLIEAAHGTSNDARVSVLPCR